MHEDFDRIRVYLNGKGDGFDPGYHLTRIEAYTNLLDERIHEQGKWILRFAGLAEVIEKARDRYPASDTESRLSGLLQEAGEVIQAVMKFKAGLDTATHVREEVLQLAGQCVRILEECPDLHPSLSEVDILREEIVKRNETIAELEGDLEKVMDEVTETHRILDRLPHAINPKSCLPSRLLAYVLGRSK